MIVHQDSHLQTIDPVAESDIDRFELPPLEVAHRSSIEHRNAVIGDASGFPVDDNGFLRAMKRLWF